MSLTCHKIGTRDEWLAAQERLLVREKDRTRLGDEIAQQRRKPPWVTVEKEYRFDTDDGEKTPVELFDASMASLEHEIALVTDASRVAREDARVFASSFTLEGVRKAAHEIVTADGRAEAAQVDTLAEQAVEQHAGDVAEKEGGIDVSINAIGIPRRPRHAAHRARTERLRLPIAPWTSTQLLRARRRPAHGSKAPGVILTLTAWSARLAIAGTGGRSVD
jgi:Bacterial protein of unknown function (DUF899)/Enoyl-(Acyl carrier protein) reductase